MSQSLEVASADSTPARPLKRITKIFYGSGDFGRASFNTLRQIFYAIFLTDVVGIDPRLASIAALAGIIWDAINDPLVGAISDNVRTRWGRRRPFLILFSIPFALAFILLWWAPPWHSQGLLLLHVTLAYMVSDTIQTLVTVPYLALTPELAEEYDDRTSLTSFRMFFNLVASMVAAVAAPSIVEASVKAGHTLQQGYITVAAIFGGIAIIPFFLIFFTVKERPISNEVQEETLTFKQTLRLLWANTPFRFATGIYVLNWISADVVSLMIPYFLLYWISQGDFLAKINIFGQKVATESVVLGVLMLTATLTVPFWNHIAHKYGKRNAYISGMAMWVLVQIGIFFVYPGSYGLMIGLIVLAGIGISNAHILPESIFPDVIDWDELRTNHRREGMYYGAINFIRKLASALAIFISLQVLGWFGYQSPPEGAVVFTQSPQTLTVIRLLTGPLVAVFLIAAVFFAWNYPLNREKQARIRRLLQKRQKQPLKPAALLHKEI